MDKSNVSTSSNFTCNSCQIQFPTSEDQRVHMKGEWHRYNLKRRVSQLPPIAEAVFNSKVAIFKKEEELQNQDFADDKLTRKELRKKQKEELLEKKRKLLELAKNRIGSNAGLVKMSEDGKLIIEREHKEEEQVKQEVIEALEKEKEEEITPEGLIKEKIDNRIVVPNEWCIFCMPSSIIKQLKNKSEEEKGNDEELVNSAPNAPKQYKFETIDGTISHLFSHHNLYLPEIQYISDKEGLLAYLYDKLAFGNVCLSCNYQGRDLDAVRHHMISKRHIRVPFESEDEKLELGNFYDFSSTWETSGGVEAQEQEDGEWEDVSESELENEEVSPEEIIATNSGLHLPNGLVVGHRSLMRYYKQNIPGPREIGEAEGTVMAAETRRGLSNMLVDREEVKEVKRVWKKEAKSRDRDDRRAAKFINWQPHYRDQLLQ